MMTAEDYKDMLKKAMEEVSERVVTKKRFEIPQAQIEVQGAKTLIKNFKEVSTTLRRSRQHLGTFLLKQLATAGSVQDSGLVLQGVVDGERIQKKIEEYAKEYVYCGKCGKPDTKLVKEGGETFLRCEACGSRYPVGR